MRAISSTGVRGQRAELPLGHRDSGGLPASAGGGRLVTGPTVPLVGSWGQGQGRARVRLMRAGWPRSPWCRATRPATGHRCSRLRSRRRCRNRTLARWSHLTGHTVGASSSPVVPHGDRAQMVESHEWFLLRSIRAGNRSDGMWLSLATARIGAVTFICLATTIAGARCARSIA